MTRLYETILLSETATTEDPDLELLTTAEITGTGVFDVLMAATKTHLLEEYNAGRITGEEYATVYLGAMQAVLQQAVQYILGQPQLQLINAQAALTRQKIATELAQTDDTLPEGLGFNSSTSIGGLIALEKDKLDLEKDLTTAQITASQREGDLVGQKVITELAQTCDSLSQGLAAGLGYNDSANIQGFMESNIYKSSMEADLLEQKIVTEVSQTSNTKPATLGQMNSTTAITGLAAVQKEKSVAEVTLLSQKAMTELAQTSDALPSGTSALNTNTTVAGLVSKQKSLYAAQTDGFARDAEQKLAQMLINAWSVSCTQGEADANSTNNLDDTSLGSVIAKTALGIGVTL